MLKFFRFEVKQDLCRQCGACLRVCPKDAICEGTGAILFIDRALCDGCGLCQSACKLRAIVKKRTLFS